tara:strand:+ start:469 stop:1089 length:621 start_codon:yes stop_codon:yes gene_type:complete
MKFLVNNIDTLVNEVVVTYNTQKKLDSTHKSTISNTLGGMFGNNDIANKLVDSIVTLTNNDLDVGDAYYTKTDGEPTLKKFMVNEARLRQANESRGRMKNEIDDLLSKLVGSIDNSYNVRVTNIDSFSALMDRLSTERIKKYNFLHKQDKPEEASHQERVIEIILDKIEKLLVQIITEKGYLYVGEKRTFDENKLIKDVSEILKNI